jgi:hypothetical protein
MSVFRFSTLRKTLGPSAIATVRGRGYRFTATLPFKGRAGDIATIAGRPRVANVLEGSVRKSSERVRITAQLIRAGSGCHLWSQTFDRGFDDIFRTRTSKARSWPKRHVGSRRTWMSAKTACCAAARHMFASAQNFEAAGS